MLKAHQACIDLEKNALRIQGREVQFLAEHELPDQARLYEMPVDENGTPVVPPSAGPSTSQFPGSGVTLGSAPASSGAPQAHLPPPPSQNTADFPENDIETLMNLGATRETALQALRTAAGNVEYAAALLFSG